MTQSNPNIELTDEQLRKLKSEIRQAGWEELFLYARKAQKPFTLSYDPERRVWRAAFDVENGHAVEQPTPDMAVSYALARNDGLIDHAVTEQALKNLYDDYTNGRANAGTALDE